MRNTLPESISLPETSFSNRDDNPHDHALEEDAKALRYIFSTPSSVRGYKAARATHRPDDVAGHTPTKSASDRFGAFGHAVKQRISESRLSKESSRTVLKKKLSEDSPGRRGLICTSYKSTGLSDILVSRTASEGGYDSDAKAISSLSLRVPSSPESSNISPEHLADELRSQKDASPKKSGSAPASPEQKANLLDVAPDTQNFGGQVTPVDLARACRDLREVTVPVERHSNLFTTVGNDGERKIVSSPSEAISDQQSVHLGDMRISQRLASTSIMPMASLSSTNFGSSTEHDAAVDLSPDITRIAALDMQAVSSDNDLPLHLQRKLSSPSRYPGFIAQEHNRRPSDPKTRRLFEDATDGNKLYPTWRSVTSTSNIETNLKEAQRKRGGGSSHSVDERELPGSGATSLMDRVHSQKIKNPNSLAVPGRRASAGMDQLPRSLGRLSAAEEGAYFGEHEKQHSGQVLSVSSAPHEKVSDGVSTYGEGESVSKHESMSEIRKNVLQEKRQEEMSETGPETQVPKPRRRRNSTETRSTTGSQGWLTQGRRSGFGYDFIERTSSHDSRLSRGRDEYNGPRGETAAHVWDRAFKKTRKEDSVESASKPMLSVPFWSSQAERRVSSSRSGERKPHDVRRPKSVSSGRKLNPSETISGYLDPPDSHQEVVVDARKPLPRLSAQGSVRTRHDNSSQATAIKESLRKNRMSYSRRYSIAGMDNVGSASLDTPRDFPTWCKFPLHTRKERNGPAGNEDGVKARDFSSPTLDQKRSESKSDLTIHERRSESSNIASHPGPWQKRALGHVRKRSKSMTFTRVSGPPKHKLAHRGLFWQLRDFYRSQSSDLRRLRAGHRSSVTLGRQSKYPELDIPAGFGPLTPFDVSPAPSSKMTVGQELISKSMGDDNIDSTERDEAELWQTGTGLPTGLETENCFLAGEARRWSPQKARFKSNFSSGFDGTVSSRISEEHAGDIKKPDSDMSSARQHHWNGTCSSFVSVTASNGFGDGGERFGVQTQESRLASTELRDSTIDFRTALMERERRSRDDLLRLAYGLDRAGEGYADSESGEKRKGSELNQE